MNDLSSMLIGALVTVLALLGLIMAAGATDGGIAVFGYLLFLFGVLFVFWLIKRHYDELDKAG
ncbi:MAG: hypothetical protein KIT81_05375 [Alphaproteobacteria bacterium]|nr:hypothetical protein [Alphaproteobacteria bacterium]MCW5750559.1 hypothetical protein [Alphaproteobacteria bacterium]